MPKKTLANFMNLSMPYAVGSVFSSVLTRFVLCGPGKQHAVQRNFLRWEVRVHGGRGFHCPASLHHITYVTHLSSEGCPMPPFLVGV